MNIQERDFYLQQAMQDMDAGTSRRIACPDCGDRTLSVTRDNAGCRTLYHCFRASCGLSGVMLDRYVPPTEPQLPLQTLKPCGIAMENIANEDLRMFECLFYLTDATFLRNTVRVTEYDDFALEIISPQGGHRGWVIRQPWSKLKNPRWIEGPYYRRGSGPHAPKALTYLDVAGPKLSWYRPHFGTVRDPLYVVEDQVSAMRVREAGLPAVALLGTDLTLQGVREMRQAHSGPVVFALDPDATEKAFKMASQWGLAFKQTRVKMLDKDIKNMYPTELTQLLQPL